MIWEVGTFIMAMAVATSASHVPIQEEMEARDEYDATGSLINKTESLGDDEVFVNNADLQAIPEDEYEIDDEDSMDERKRRCSPILSCTLAGGHCVKSRAKCNGKVDPWGCRGGKKCMCCIPDQTTTAPCPTYATTTIPGRTVNPNLKWLGVGKDRFVRFAQKETWVSARALCRANGLDLYQPQDIVAVSTYLDNNFSESWYWLGGRGNVTHQVWFSGDVLTWADPWYRPSTYFRNGTDYCMMFITHSGWGAKKQTLFTDRCTIRKDDVLCG